VYFDQVEKIFIQAVPIDSSQQQETKSLHNSIAAMSKSKDVFGL
jgi:hypothetical protein